MLSPEEASALKLDDVAMVVWQAPLPTGATADVLHHFLRNGGVVVFFPPTQSDPNAFAALQWGETNTASEDRPFRVVKWRANEGPLAQTQDGTELPLLDLTFLRRQTVLGDATTLASFEDGKPLLIRKQLERGAVYFWASLPQSDWSTLAEGTVLVPALQRMLNDGARRLSRAMELYCGDEWLNKVGQASCLSDPDANGQARRPSCFAGVYQVEGRLVAVNRPPAEDATETIDEPKLRSLFGNVSLRMFEEKGAGATKLHSEIWRGFLAACLLLLIAESFLALPVKHRARVEGKQS